MGLQAIAPKDGNPVFLMDQDTGDMTTAHWAARQGVSFQRESASIAFSATPFSATRWLPGSKTVGGSRGRGRVVARASVTAGVCVLGLFIGAVWDDGLCGESKTHAQAFIVPTEKGHKIAQPDALRDKSSLVSQVALPIGLCAILQATRGLRPADIWLAILLGHATRCALSVWRFRQGKWRAIRVD